MKVLAGVVAPDAGTVTLDGQPWTPRGPADARARGLAMVHQELALCPHLDVAANVALGIEPTRLGVVRGRDQARLVDAALARAFGDRPVDPRARVAELSVADRQLVEVARALATATRHRRRPARPRPRRAHEQPRGRRRRAPLRPRARSRGRRRRPCSTSRTSSRRSRASPTRFTVLRDGATVGAGRRGATTADGRRRPHDGRPRRRERLPAHAAHRRARSSCRRATSPARACPSRRASSCGAARCSASAAWSARGGRSCCACSSASTACAAASSAWAPPSARPRRRRRLAQGVGFASEDRKGEGLATSLSIADNLTLSRLGPSGFGAARPHAGRGVAVDRASSPSSAPAPTSASWSSRAATSRRCSSRGCSTTTSTCCSSTSRRAASTSGARRRSRRLVDELAAQRQGGPPRVELAAGAARAWPIASPSCAAASSAPRAPPRECDEAQPAPGGACGA